MKNNKFLILSGAFFLMAIVVRAQNAWTVSDIDSEKKSIYIFDEDFELDGNIAYDNFCSSCHGDPGLANYTPMVPPPGDIASETFQSQPDGSLYTKIKTGRAAMPAFEDAFSDRELWQLVSFIRSFNETYVQPVPDLDGIVIPVYSIETNFDDNVDKVVVKVFDEEKIPVKDVSVSVFVKSMFGKYLLGKSVTNDYGISYIDIDTKLPGDASGNIPIMVKANKGYGSANMVKEMQIVSPYVKKSAIEGRHLWSVRAKAPYWLIGIFNLTVIGIWGTIFYVLIGLRKIKKLT